MTGTQAEVLLTLTVLMAVVLALYFAFRPPPADRA